MRAFVLHFLAAHEGHGLEAGRHLERSTGGVPDLLHGDSRGKLGEDHLTGLLVEFEDAQLSDHNVNNTLPGQGQSALGQDLVVALGGVLHRHHHPGPGGHEVHGPAHTLHHLARDDPVRQVTVGSHLQGTEDGELHVPAADHCERIVGPEDRGGGEVRHGLLTRVDKVGVGVGIEGVRAHTEQAVLALELNVHPLGDVVGGQRRHPDAEVHVHTVLELEGSPPHDPLAGVQGRRVHLSRLGPGVDLSLLLAHGAPLNALLVLGRADDTVHEHTGNVHVLGGEGASRDDLLSLDDGDLARGGHRRVEVARGPPEAEVAPGVGLVRLDKGVITRD
eukprot:Hpha_TRINITY_DN11234_c0_g1::TRINITY_DN11234_c0_g1_i1::g.167434::m.167434